MATNPRLVDTSTKSVHQLSAGAKYLLASHSHLFPPSLDTQASSISPPLHLLLPPPLTHNEQYCVQLEVDDEGSCLVSVWVGECSVDKKIVPIKCNQVSLSHESLLKLGKDLVLQYNTNSEGLQRRRVLPQTPGQQLSVAPPSKPTRTQPLPLPERNEAVANGDSSSLSLEESLNPGLRERLKRIAREVNSRESGAGRSKPPPPYEQVGNSIGYQLLLQQQSSEGDVTSLMIDSLYPMLKYMQLKEQSLEQFYTDYLEQYSAARRAGATPTNMHPEDTPTIVFVVDTLIQLCSLPRVNELAVRYCPVWMRLLSIFCHSPRNQLAMATKRLATKVVSCMGLGIMAEQPDFQTHGWSVLTHVVATPTPRGSKPALPEPAIALALPLVEKQLELFGGQLPLATAILGFLSRLASTAKLSQTRDSGKGGVAEEEEEVYTLEQASRVLELLSAHSVLRHVMKVPPNVRKDPSFDAHYCLLVKALVPTRKKVATKPPSSLAPSAHSTSSLAPPPAKPKRIRRAATDANLMGSRVSKESG
ncbi:hypothetical protein GBAR_LOCUS17015 [Geodia barretti]|uniref:Uncharacterized protein n=1 Tax=Geodia barretti TaxID=519541 RepID=A0AA35WV38_GEOBA|nr:hypothetical protein GBAR_LOCUS17015 [Geodia barretti]